MLKVKNDSKISLSNLSVSYKDSIKLDPLKEGEKISILSDSMLKTMFQNENRIKYSAKFISYYLDISFEKLLKNIHLSKNELDKDKEYKKGEKCDYVAVIDDTSINIEVNNNGSINVLERNMEYAHRMFSKLIEKGKKENEYTQVIQFNLNNFSFIGNDKIVDTYVIQNDEYIKLSDKLIFIQIFIPNLIRKWYNLGKSGLDEKERYLLSLVLRNIDDAKELGEGIKIMEEYVDEAEFVLSDDLKESYDKEWALKDLGKQLGKEEGIKEAKKEAVINFHKNKVDKDIIAKSLNININEVEEILKEAKR